MKVGILLLLSNPHGTPEFVHALGEATEERGFHSIWVAEHVVLFDDYASKYPYSPDGRIPTAGERGPIDPLIALSFLAACTTRIRLGTGVCLVPQRNPVYTAKEVASVDWLSNGRVDFGVGVGWLAEEFKVLGVPFERRGARCREYLRVMKKLWCDPVSSYEGEFYTLPPCRQYPKPIQQPHPPIHFGGESDAALKRVADLGQGWFGFNIAPDDVAKRLEKLDGLLRERGRSRKDVFISASPPRQMQADLDLLKRYRDAGAEQVIVVTVANGRDRLLATLDGFANRLVAPAGRL
jgi:probable F420-dependent oxidoreductase